MALPVPLTPGIKIRQNPHDAHQRHGLAPTQEAHRLFSQIRDAHCRVDAVRCPVRDFRVLGR